MQSTYSFVAARNSVLGSWSTYMCWNATSGVHGYGCAEAGPMKYTDLTSWRQDWMVVNVSVTYLQMA